MSDHDISLKAHFDRILEETDKRYSQRFEDQALAVKTALDAAKEAVNAAMAAAEKAVSKAEGATEKRLEGVNEFRKSLEDQQTTFVRQDVADARFKSIETQLAETRGRGDGLKSAWGYIFAFIASGVALLSIFHRP